MTHLSMDPLTLGHTAITLIGIVTGLVVLAGLLEGRLPRSWNTLFLLFTVLTSVTGLAFFPNNHPVTPGQIVAVISLVDLAIALYALYGRRLEGSWRAIYVVTGIIALYFNVFVLVVQTFAKLPPLKAIAPGNPPSGPVFMAVQAIVLLAFIYFGWKAKRDFKVLIK